MGSYYLRVCERCKLLLRCVASIGEAYITAFCDPRVQLTRGAQIGPTRSSPRHMPFFEHQLPVSRRLNKQVYFSVFCILKLIHTPCDQRSFFGQSPPIYLALELHSESSSRDVHKSKACNILPVQHASHWPILPPPPDRRLPLHAMSTSQSRSSFDPSPHNETSNGGSSIGGSFSPNL